MTELDCPLVSVIIPVFNDAERLALCLAALAQQTYARSRYEVIVVDNGSEQPEQIQAVAAPYDWVTIAMESTPGSYAARNKGLTLAQGEVIAFTDADCIPAVDWLERGVAHLRQTPNCGLIAGRIEIFFKDPQRPTSVELYESITAFPQERLLSQFHGGATANLFTWRAVIDRVGGFDDQLKSNGDLDWGKRVHAQGYEQRYAEQVLVLHPARASLGELYGRTRRLVGGYYGLRLKQAQSLGQRQAVFLQMLLQNLVPPVSFAVNAALDTRLSSVGQKLKVSWVMVLVRYISAWETLRLKLGGVSSRA
ncbi:MAG: glycosyltransferase [Leptolyngbya sp. SIO4C1]|nr:glycosyltransferase [Leptolyngbya sp. SIO4C1]